MSQLAALKSATTTRDIAHLLQTTLSGLTAIVYATSTADKYKAFEIPKRGGGTRLVNAPNEKLKLLQQKLSLLLQDCLDEITGQKARKDNVAHGFKRKRSILTNAKQHRHRRWVLNLDLHEFFPSIHFGRVRGYFIQDRNFALPANIATLIAQIACDGKALPQGSPCSPVISNLVAHIMDMHIVRLAADVGCMYSRYADDLTFSTNKKDFPPEIAICPADQPHIWQPGERLWEIINHSNFQVNPRNTRMQYRDSRQEVTGLVVNDKINIRWEYRHNVRAMVRRLFRTGSFQVYGPVTKEGVTTLGKREGKLDELHGRLGFIDSIDLYNKKNQPHDKSSQRISKKEEMYRQFLIYKDFYIAQRPVILCEGKTDNVYLKHAIRCLAAQFPQLAELDDQGKPRLKVRLYKYAKSSTGRILGLKDGGTGNLPEFIGKYKKETEKFEAPGLENPLIILFDNDSGADPIYGAIRSATGKTANPDVAFTHVVKNLYAVATPLVEKKQSKIEDFFDATTTGTVLGGKTFDPEHTTFEKANHYGKAIFAEKVVAAHAATINFDGFIPFLQNICLVIDEHAKRFGGQPEQPPS
ncbi:MAG: retron Ec67 family RNA-directed DNA polymerase/endonuclease [Acidobacteriota bacterium]|nr:retron Ec67 family RNA-directed DNA polymerase/endonuclease [Acidobacteriota bacterium]